jgi:hypothetical protein
MHREEKTEKARETQKNPRTSQSRWQLLLIALLAAAVLAHGSGGKQGAIERAQAEAAELRLQRDSLASEIEVRDEERAALLRDRAAYEAQAAALRRSVAELERRRAEQQLTVREIRTTGALMDRLRASFPEFGDSAWGLATVPLEPGDTLGMEYLMAPAWFAETFVIDHANAQSWRAQKDALMAVDSLRLAVTALQDSITRLTEATAVAYRAGYESAYERYTMLSERYVRELRKPRIRLGTALGFILGAGTGIIAVELIR